MSWSLDVQKQVSDWYIISVDCNVLGCVALLCVPDDISLRNVGTTYKITGMTANKTLADIFHCHERLKYQRFLWFSKFIHYKKLKVRGTHS
jgi:hypothetical protein